MAALAAGLAGCSHTRSAQGEPDNAPTLKTLSSRPVDVQSGQAVPRSDEKTIAAYREFLNSAPRAPQRSEAMRRIADLEMDASDDAPPPRAAGAPVSAAAAAAAATPAAAGAPATGGKATAESRGAIALYLDLLKNYPNDPGNDRVLYQLARAYEQGGAIDDSLKTLGRLVQQYPATPYRDEAQFRRGEMLFATKEYAKAEQAYATVLQSDKTTPYYERSLYMHGWSIFKQGRLDDALNSFFGVLDLKLAGRSNDGPIESIPGLTRADRELVEDTFRVTGLCLENLQGAESIPPYMNSDVRHEYEPRVYDQLAQLYLKQDRIKDAADAYGAFVKRNPLHAQAPILQARVIEIYQKGGFGSLALEGKKEYVARYGAQSEFRRANPAAWDKAQPLVKSNLAELARHYHALAQKGHRNEDYQEAARWYRAYLDSFPNDPTAPETNFLLAELLFEGATVDQARYAEAATEYEKVAYKYPRGAHSADAGYSALLAYAELERRSAPGAVRGVQLASVESAKRFGAAFKDDPRSAPVLTHAAEQLYAQHIPDQASALAQQVLALNPPPAAAQRRVAWTVVAHSAFEAGDYARAERGYGEVLALAPANDAARGDLIERLAASIYKQGEQARAAGNPREAASHFARVGTAAPTASIRPNAQFDAAASLIALKDWDAAARTLEDFRQRFPNSPLQADVSNKLAVVYLEKQQWAPAASELERMAAEKKDPKLARDAQWQAGELYEKGGAKPQAAAAYERYLRQYPEPLETAEEARFRLARLARDQGDHARELQWMNELLQAEQRATGGRTERTRFLGASAALALAEPVYDEFHRIALVEPLQRQLKLKKAKMEDVLKAYGAASQYGVAEITTAATYKTAEVYHEFGRAILDSERPRSLGKAELEQYNVLLEEQAFPFEEKAIELHELNAHRTADGIYDKSVRDSFAALRQLRPVRYGKSELGEVVVDAIR
ncbi:MAG TPA: tetratricopeptide repeat protein [Burkholderiaceae bacterium]|nr:tetratricopeptide repeat protein [Burkholderiaceae bacterium]